MTSQRFAATITAQYVNPPRGNAISGNVKDTQGNSWGVPASQLYRFQPGGTYQIMYWQKAKPQGGAWNNVVSVNGEDLGERAAPQQMPAQQAQAPLPPQQPAQQPMQQPLASSPPPPSVSQHDKEMYMFIMGVVGRSMGSGKFEANDIKVLTLAASDAWKALHKAPEPPQAQTNSEAPAQGPMSEEPTPWESDEIPF